MVREIKFRAWDKTFKKMCAVAEIEFMEGDKPFIIVNFLRLEGKACDLMQYTGLKDKNGEEIYEGDVAKGILDGDTHVWEVSWAEDRETLGWSITPQDVENGLEVIGNIYENPDLLKEK